MNGIINRMKDRLNKKPFTHDVVQDQETTNIEEWFHSHLPELQEEHGGKVVAIIEPGKFLVERHYIELIDELEKRDVDLNSVVITNVPR
ncbi:MAG: hypothetical protein KGY66_06930 [Candidatus Thermoplasmatota archaeon]|nr:hypothetical protein [Candidatus Thermoplasmatota archaeon]MBS3790634.1 hypothetical protein [Candidatus Thermoplasmatota archaeon]